jgi:hypothetical protein
MGRYVDLTGQRFGKLTVIERAVYKKERTYWRCLCDCGKIVKVDGSALRRGHSKSCGCARAHKGMHIKHGLRNTRLYKIWAGIKQRCLNQKAPDFKHYGGRGITICEEWRDDFKPFYNWATANGYTDKLSIDRIDVNGNYCPDNCRWVTQKEQGNNTRTNRRITYQGQTHTLQEWATITGLSSSTINQRLKRGWTVEQTLKAPTK